MTIETQLREALDDHAEAFELGSLASLGDITKTAQKRTRRNRVLTGAGAVVLAVMVAVGIGGLGRTDESGLTVVTEITDDELELLNGQPLVPQTIVANGDTFVGIAIVRLDDELDPLVRASVPVVSDDGLTWRPTAETKTWRTASIELVKHDKTFHVVAVDDESIVHATSTDFVSWSERVDPLPEEVRQSDDDLVQLGSPDLGVDGLFVDDSGTTVLLSTVPGGSGALNSVLAPLLTAGMSSANVCHLESANGVGTYRECGTTTSQTFAYDGDTRRVGETNWHVVRSEGDQAFAIATNYDESDVQALVEFSLRPNGRNVFLDRRIDGPAVYYSTDQQSWERLAVSTLYPGEEGFSRNTTELVRGSGGWAFTILRWRSLRPESSVTAFEVAENGFVLESTAPYGPGTLRNPAGEVVRTWDQFELTNLAWSGLVVTASGVTVLDEASELPIATFSHQVWANALAPSRIDWASDVIYSPDGQTWTRIARSDAALRVVAVGDDEVIARSAGPGDVFATDLTGLTVDERIPFADGLTYVTQPTNQSPGIAVRDGGQETAFDVLAAAVDESLGDGDGTSSSDGSAPVFPPASAAEPLDVTQPGSGTGAEAEALFNDLINIGLRLEGVPIVEGSIDHVATAELFEGRAERFGYERINAAGQAERCTTVKISGPSTTSGPGTCDSGPAGTELPPTAYSAEFSEFGRAAILERAPAGAAWMVIQTSEGNFVRSGVIDGFAVAEWPRELGPARWMSVQDADFNEIWAEDISR